MALSCWSIEPFLFAFGLVTSAICCGIGSRSRSRRRYSERSTTALHDTLPEFDQFDDVAGADIPSRPPLPRIRRVAYDDFNPLEPP